jgi:hypothetical protein
MASTLTLQSVVNSMRAYPDLQPVLDVGGFTQEPALTIANDVMQKFLAQGLNWKFNRAIVPLFLSVPLQQDYVSSVVDLGWMEQGWRLDINNTMVPKPVFGMEAVRDLAQTAYQANPFNLSWIPNALAIMGKWMPLTLYPCGYGGAYTLPSPIQQFIDANGNILYIRSAALGLSLNTPGIGGPGFVAPTTPYGTSAAVQPVLPANSVAGTTVVDGTVTWTVADPNGVAVRIVPLPACSGISWLISAVYQKAPPLITSLQGFFTPIPDSLGFLIRQGFRAGMYDHAGNKNADKMYVQWEEALMTALRSADREREDASFYPSQGLTSGSPFRYGMPTGASWPYDFYGGY